MNPLRSTFPAKTSIGYQPSARFDSYLKTDRNNKSTGNTPGRQPLKAENPSIQIASLLAHELRNPLTNINLSIDMLEYSIKDKELKGYIDIIKRSSTRINSLISEFLKHQQMEVQIEKHSLRELLEEVLEMARDRIELKKITIRKVYAIQDDTIMIHRPNMKIALTNLVINAIDSMASGKGELSIITKSTVEGYFITIEDNGCGISKENLKYIFKPYFTNKPGGLGLGLAATDAILRSNQVGVNVESVEGVGTKFILLFRNSLHNLSFNGKNRSEVRLVY